MLNPYGYPCGAHVHATPTARKACIGPSIRDEIPELGLVGWVSAIRPPEPAKCLCGHWAQIHTPTGRMDDTDIRGEGTCTAGTYGRRCGCIKYEEKKR